MLSDKNIEWSKDTRCSSSSLQTSNLYNAQENLYNHIILSKNMKKNIGKLTFSSCLYSKGKKLL